MNRPLTSRLQNVLIRYSVKVASQSTSSRFSSLKRPFSNDSQLQDILENVSSGKLSPNQALTLINDFGTATNNNNIGGDKDTERLQSFVRIDHERSHRTGFPEVVFAQGKTSIQVCKILDNMAKYMIQRVVDESNNQEIVPFSAILATRVTPQQYKEMTFIPLKYGKITYYDEARVVSMLPTGIDDTSFPRMNNKTKAQPKVVVASAGTTDIPVCEEAAVVLEAAGCEVDRVYDAGVAGLHRIINAIPKLRDPAVRCVIVCAGMDGALPSVVGGLINSPVIAVPTSVGYGACFGGVSALLTMLNTCSPGVGVVNIDNGFGAAALAYKMIHSSENAARNEGT